MEAVTEREWSIRELWRNGGSEGYLEVHTQNINCSYAKFDSVVLGGLDPSEYSVTSTHYCNCSPTPDTSFITLTPKLLGKRDVKVHFHYTDDEFNQIDTSLTFTLAVKPSASSIALNAYLKDVIATRTGDTIDIPIYLSGKATLAGQTQITLPFALDTNVLRVLGFDPANTNVTAGPLAYATDTVTVQFQATDLTLNGETLIGWLRCVEYLSDTLKTSISLSNPHISTEATDCVSLSTDSKTLNLALTGCGDSTLLEFMQNGLASLLFSVSPNPAGNFLDIRMRNDRAELLCLRVADALGMARLTAYTDSTEMLLDLSPLPDGVYFIELGHDIRKVIIARP